MFDGLKDKLGSFREDAEEAAEENAEPVEDDESLPEDDEARPEDDEAVPDEEPSAAESEPSPEAAERSDAERAPGDASAEPAAEDAAEATGHESADSAADASGDAQASAGDESVGEATDESAEEGAASGGVRRADLLDASAEASGSSESAAEEEDDVGFTKKARSFTKGKFVVEEEDLEGPLQDLEMALLASDVELEVAQALLDRIRDELVGSERTFTTSTGAVVEDALREALLDVISVGQFDFDGRIAEADEPVVIVFTGVNGVGKTTSIAKLVRYLEERGHDSVVANGDTFRAGANEQIEEHAENLDVKLIAHEQGGDPAAVIYDAVEYAEANDVDVVLGDTAGRLHTSEGLMDQLEKIDRVVDPDMTLFVDEAVAGQDAVNRAREFHDAAPIDGTVLTKADADSQGGAAISIAHVTGKPILFLGTGQDYDDVERFDPEWLVDQLLGA